MVFQSLDLMVVVHQVPVTLPSVKVCGVQGFESPVEKENTFS